MANFKLGDKVRITGGPWPRHFDLRGRFGVIKGLDRNPSFPYRVMVDNDDSNHFAKNELELVQTGLDIMLELL